MLDMQTTFLSLTPPLSIGFSCVTRNPQHFELIELQSFNAEQIYEQIYMFFCINAFSYYLYMTCDAMQIVYLNQ